MAEREASCRSRTRADDDAPYFSLILVPGDRAAAMSGAGGKAVVVGLGPGAGRTG